MYSRSEMGLRDGVDDGLRGAADDGVEGPLALSGGPPPADEDEDGLRRVEGRPWPSEAGWDDAILLG